MRRFLASAWFPFLTALFLGGVAVAAYALLKPLGADISNAEILRAAKIAGWVTGPVMAILSLLLMFVLNGIRRIVRLRKTALLHPVVVLCGTVPWLLFGWQLTGEPRYTPFGIAVIEFVARPMLWGGLVVTLVVLVFSIPLLVLSRKA